MKKVLIVFSIIMVIIAILLILRGEEDAWICEGGRWVKHGSPSSSLPIQECK